MAAFYHAAADILEVRFDKPLVDGATAAANWTGEIILVNGLPVKRDIGGAAPGTVTAKVVTVPCLRAGVGGANHCDYAAIPADLITRRTGLPVAAFTDFPLTVV